VWVKRNRSHTQTHNKNNTTLDTTRTTPQTTTRRTTPPHLTTIECGDWESRRGGGGSWFDSRSRARKGAVGWDRSWPLQDIRWFIRGLCTSRYYSWRPTLLYCNPPPLYCAINIAKYMVSPRPSCSAIQHTILVIAIFCKGQPSSFTQYCHHQ